ncbi:hypothetical protein Vse01_44360 [Micromonospora sediminimaris]|uniref:Uncharacterized protein n=1 Tax=Micromonospora sediminimaris TaxID=547162 RepID=A0A9W5UW08_9ACTN|nr:hypothetical protein Vse01_44360 [Micromonospora sediminimaris]
MPLAGVVSCSRVIRSTGRPGGGFGRIHRLPLVVGRRAREEIQRPQAVHRHRCSGLLVIVRVLAALWQDRDGAKGALLATYTIEQRTVFRHAGESPPKDRMLGHDEWP